MSHVLHRIGVAFVVNNITCLFMFDRAVTQFPVRGIDSG